jgi:hypothetical protein
MKARKGISDDLLDFLERRRGESFPYPLDDLRPKTEGDIRWMDERLEEVEPGARQALYHASRMLGIYSDPGNLISDYMSGKWSRR